MLLSLGVRGGSGPTALLDASSAVRVLQRACPVTFLVLRVAAQWLSWLQHACLAAVLVLRRACPSGSPGLMACVPSDSSGFPPCLPNSAAYPVSGLSSSRSPGLRAQPRAGAVTNLSASSRPVCGCPSICCRMSSDLSTRSPPAVDVFRRFRGQAAPMPVRPAYRFS